SNMARTAFDVQRDFALSSALRSEIIWDALSSQQSEVLKQKIASIICEANAKNVEKQRQQLFDRVWEQRVYTNGTLLSSIIYVLVADVGDPQLALQATHFSCHPVVRTRKCLQSEAGDNSENCCMIFVDELGRVYPNWTGYLQYNSLPKGLLIAPRLGVYTFGGAGEDQLLLTVQRTPASGLKQKLLQAGDSIACMVSVPVAATLVLPVATPLLIAATAVGVSTAAYSTLRSVGRLIDRRWHAQSNSLRDREARSSWLGVVGGLVGLGATGATTAVSVASNRATLGAHLAVRGLNVSAIVVSGGGVLNGVYDLYLKVSDDESLTSYDVLQLASSLLIFTHSVNNLRIASKVSNGASLRRELRQQTRKAFDRIAQESSKLQVGGKRFKLDIVRTLNDIPVKESLLALHKLHSHLAQGATWLTAAGAAAGAIGLLPSFVVATTGGELRLDVRQLAEQFGLKFVQQIGNLASLMDVLEASSRYYSKQAVEFLLRLTRSFVEQQVEGIDRQLNTFVSTELVLYRILMHCINNYEHHAVDFLERRRQHILDVVGNYFESLQPDPEVDAEHGASIRHKCNVCQGVYYVSTL
ncbi:hypothetical protein KR044_013071, partial [Drosophila immigrans]